ncbi:polysaccharide biosynthesis/export family protein [Dyella mobilis]|uniref:Polysaccharide biosynthesis/export family protein n=1 Tax=Dyella mobilis TaxID=1849582 RepID=A0ABS2KIR8_9GAMM|nr:polysaccharide biosynthesis/export family protein [Dyella mobilis]MBM7131026.1 polysaccharide biosynthesis/export family protein [Dyella mobilis]GLQ97653.1 capsular polysaccharide biosynthesis protein [Dyella mobilis]
MSDKGLVRGTPTDNSQIQLVTITPQLLAANSPTTLSAAIPDALLAYKPEPYRIGPGDTLYITVWDHPELTSPAGMQQQTAANGRLVRSDGTLFYPYLGAVHVAGMTIEQLRAAITGKLATYVKDPQVDVNVVGYNSQHVMIQGAFLKTDPQPITAVPLTLWEALGTATINNNVANLSDLILSRDGQDYHLDLAALNGDRSIAKDIFLKSGDRLYMPYNDTREVYVMGEVMRPMAINFGTADHLSLTQALGRVGGLNPLTSSGKQVYVIRGANDLQHAPAKVFQLDARSPSAFALGDEFRVKEGDVVFVGPAGITRWNRVLSQILPSATLLSTAAYTNYSVNQTTH